MISGTVVDTSIWVNYYDSIKDEKSEIVNKLIDADEIVILPVILQETLQGIKVDKIFELTKELLLSYQYISINPIYSAIRSAELYRFLRKKGITINKPNDCLIAAICIENDIPIFHNDKDFDNIAKHTSLKIYKS
ncbi:MAG TPA: PIN domain-containing protein [Hanamia sp.]|jgi:predicted nucleic acid-binding protein|nr:PIN domain-containing protein [Hanamia sp.]